MRRDAFRALFAGVSLMGRVRVGVGGWVFEPWRNNFYPEGLAQKRELEYASRHLTTIEVNGTYYGSQKPASFRKWHDETPDDFVFALKGPRFTTNRRVLAEAGESIDRFFSTGVLELRDKLGPINWQFAATKKLDLDDIAAFLSLLPSSLDGRPIRHALEVRHPSFADPAFIALAREHGVAIVLAADSAFPLIPDPTAPFVYARLMGTDAAHPAGYPSAALDTWAARARTWAAGDIPDDLATVADLPKAPERDVFLYVISGAKERNPHAAMALIERL